jgi:hypothetical protein
VGAKGFDRTAVELAMAPKKRLINLKHLMNEVVGFSMT